MPMDPRLSQRRDSALRLQRRIRLAAALSGTLAVGGVVGFASRNPATATTATAASTKAATSSSATAAGAPTATAAPAAAVSTATPAPALSTPTATVAPAPSAAATTVTGGSGTVR